MKAVLPRQEFQEALGAVASLANARSPKPILGCVKLSARNDRLELSATDGEAALRAGVAALSVEKPGEAVVPADRLLGIVRELQDVEIAIATSERQCIIRAESSEFRVFTLEPADFPPVQGFEGAADFVMDAAELRRMIALTIHAAARETSRYAINGVLWEKSGRRLHLVATDGRRLARSGGSLRESESADFEAILPAKALTVLERVALSARDDEASVVRVMMKPNQAILQCGDRVLSTVLVEGHFPKYQDVIPKGCDKKAVIGREELYAAVRQAALLTTEDSRAVKLAFSPEELVITSQSPEQGDARVRLPIRYDGTPLEIAFNPAYLGEALRAMMDHEVTIELQEPFRPGVLYGADKADFLYVVMPVSL
ncbi:MAG: DNA polymerase III subunit beta [Phycisphaerae bacterium]|jgi:DNA polymerase-3 subunit beta|nr:DNA polymerase III subunit beta [Phycisphaerae bacterium]MCZ2400809.1 DNA polymerase III subunit beta [Phycisphaerae bacterium]NUQ48399.1 DNA polymerase III subunit beta [Phycisphaerae bacterium]